MARIRINDIGKRFEVKRASNDQGCWHEQKSPRKCTTRICRTCREAQRQRRIAARTGAVA